MGFAMLGLDRLLACPAVENLAQLPTAGQASSATQNSATRVVIEQVAELQGTKNSNAPHTPDC
jgi:hypothetical protein